MALILCFDQRLSWSISTWHDCKFSLPSEAFFGLAFFLQKEDKMIKSSSLDVKTPKSTHFTAEMLSQHRFRLPGSWWHWKRPINGSPVWLFTFHARLPAAVSFSPTRAALLLLHLHALWRDVSSKKLRDCIHRPPFTSSLKPPLFF